jgi:dTMP kinase
VPVSDAGTTGGGECRSRSWTPPPEDAGLDERVLSGMGSATRGLFLTFEGLDGSGKSTQMELLAEELRAAGYDVLTTREPGGTPLGEAVRAVLLDPARTGMTARAETLLYAAARAELVETIVRPALEAGRVVLCDRYIDSSLAYQGYGRGLGVEDVLMLSVWATECLFPDLTLVLLVDEGARVGRAGDTPDRLEAEELSFFERAAEGYRRLGAEHRHRIKLIDAEGTVEQVAALVRAAVDLELGLFSSEA